MTVRVRRITPMRSVPTPDGRHDFEVLVDVRGETVALSAIGVGSLSDNLEGVSSFEPATLFRDLPMTAAEIRLLTRAVVERDREFRAAFESPLNPTRGRGRVGTRTVFHWLDLVRARPGMYILQNSIVELETMIWGYIAALQVHGMTENTPSMGRHFLTWVHRRTGWSTSSGWAVAIQENSGSDDSLSVFFELVDEYRLLRPIERERASTQGFTLQLLQYDPADLYFIRVVEHRHAIDQDLLQSRVAAKDQAKRLLKNEEVPWAPIAYDSRSERSSDGSPPNDTEQANEPHERGRQHRE